MTTFAKRVNRIMLERGMSQADLARKTGLTTSNIAYIVNGKTKDPRISSAIAIAKALNVPLSYLVGVK